jgi:hypothetical protein
MRRWFTLFFIPLIPLNTVGEYVECEGCKQAFKMVVLQAPTTATLQQELLYAAREALATMLRLGRSAAGDAAALEILSELAGRAWTLEELSADVDGLDTSMLDRRLGHLAGVLNEHGKERFVSQCARAAAVDGTLDAAARDAVLRIGGALQMTPAHVRGVLGDYGEVDGAPRPPRATPLRADRPNPN